VVPGALLTDRRLSLVLSTIVEATVAPEQFALSETLQRRPSTIAPPPPPKV